jgi:hypothetical protein
VRDITTEQTLAASTATLVHAELPLDCMTTESVRDCLIQRVNPRNPANPPNPATPPVSGGPGNPRAPRQL